MTAGAGHLQSAEDDFSLVLGGPLFQLFRRLHLTGNALELVRRRIAVLALVAWVPLLVLSIIDGKAAGSAVKVPFLYDIDVHVRFLVALPLLIVAELIVHQRMRAVVGSSCRKASCRMRCVSASIRCWRARCACAIR